MLKRFGAFPAVVATCLVLALAVVSPVAAGSNRSFSAHLTGAQEAPTPVDTLAQGQLTLRLSKDGTELSYRLNVANLEDITAAHLHLGVVGMAGPPVAFLYSGDPSGPFSGVLAEGTITEADLIGPYAGQPLSTLLDAIEDGDIYVNVHTTAHPPGEIRGQVR